MVPYARCTHHTHLNPFPSRIASHPVNQSASHIAASQPVSQSTSHIAASQPRACHFVTCADGATCVVWTHIAYGTIGA